MTKHEFIGFLHEPGQMPQERFLELSELAATYPYCQSLQMLMVACLKSAGDVRYHDRLKISAAYAADRAVLRRMINLIESSGWADRQGQPLPDPAAGSAPAEKSIRELFHSPPEVAPDRKQDLLEAIQKRIDEIREARQQQELLTQEALSYNPVGQESSHPEIPGMVPDVKNPLTDSDFEIAVTPHENKSLTGLERNMDLIDKFIKEEPRIERGKTTFYDADDFADRSAAFHEDIVSETLAAIYLKQGRKEKSIAVYQKLCLLYPEKSAFFAAQIQKIKNS